jgi:DNA-binding MarR family transcriptional regulator
METHGKTSIDRAIENLISIVPLLSKNMRHVVKAKTNLTPGSIFVCGALHHHGKLSMSEIGAHVSVPKPNVTALVDKLIEDNLVERLYDQNDRRIIYIQLTEKGKDVFTAIKKEIYNEFEQKLRLLKVDQIESLAVSSQHVRDLLILLNKNQHLSETDKGLGE